MKKVSIKKIILDLDGKSVELTLSQAKRLNDILGEMFDPKVTIYQPTYPIIIERDQNDPWQTPIFTWEFPGDSWVSNTGTPMGVTGESLCIAIGE